MIINLTLFVQIFNFYIAYLILTKIFLKPALNSLRAEDQYIKQINVEIEANNKEIANKENIKISNWRQCQKYFFKQSPEIKKENIIQSNLPSALEAPQISKEQLNKLVEQVASAIKPEIVKT